MMPNPFTPPPEGAPTEMLQHVGKTAKAFASLTNQQQKPGPKGEGPVCLRCGGFGAVIVPGIPGITHTRPMACGCQTVPVVITTASYPPRLNGDPYDTWYFSPTEHP